MVAPLVSDELWREVAPLLPPEAAKPKGGRPRKSDRACLAGIVFVLRTGIGPLRPPGPTRFADRIGRLLTVDGSTCPRRWVAGRV
jgi:transposase